jgi:hypothetical protein
VGEEILHKARYLTVENRIVNCLVYFEEVPCVRGLRLLLRSAE